VAGGRGRWQAGYEMAEAVTVTVKVERKHEKLPRFVCIPLGKIEPWKISGTVKVEATLNDLSIGRRSLKRWDERKCFFH